eukprot:TRINITY_DN38627_c0_g1_i1.p1 TRINITY_DN38627_c0_g1~~TRINITY_DN38627_c0_g1_i1.p1  ORF type:complete len:872 (+),score=174.75 TRINITY_DN38627_c0_g1_i1:143-2758(+)
MPSEEKTSLLRGRTQPLAGPGHLLRFSASGDSDAIPKSVSFLRGEHGFTTNGGVVDSVVPGSQASARGVKVGWRLVCIDTNPVPRHCEGDRLDKEIHRMIRLASIKTGDYVITFTLPVPVLPALPSLDEDQPSEEEMKNLICDSDILATNSEEGKIKLLNQLEKLGEETRTGLLRSPAVVNKLLEANASSELCVLVQEKTAAEVSACHDLWRQLKAPSTEAEAPSTETLMNAAKNADLTFSDTAGDIPLHMVNSAEAAECILDAAGVPPGVARGGDCATPSTVQKFTKFAKSCTATFSSLGLWKDGITTDQEMLRKRNKRGESPLESILKRITDVAQRKKTVEMFVERAPSCLYTLSSDGSPVALLLDRDELKALSSVSLDWPTIREVLLGEDAAKIRAGYRTLAKMLSEAAPGLDFTDSELVWTALLVEHCFGVLSKDDKGQLHHTAASRERLSAVWNALKVLLKATADMTLPLEEWKKLKELTKSLLLATRGPNQAPFDPREPYRQELVMLIRSLQASMTTKLGKAVVEARDAFPEAAEEVATFPKDELHSIVDVVGPALSAPRRLRMDARLTNQPPTVAPLPTPSWVVEQCMDQSVHKDLSGPKVQDIVELAAGTSCPSVDQNLMKEEQLRFARLHAAWLRNFCASKQDLISEVTQRAAGIDGSEEGPWDVKGAYTVLEYRARSEAKGLPRLIEKMCEAISEVFDEEAKKLLNKEPGTVVNPEHEYNEGMALRSLLTPACWVCDVNGAEVVVGNFKDLAAIYKAMTALKLDKDKCQVVRTKNAFSKEVTAEDVAAKAGYRDLKIFMVLDLKGTNTISEVQLHLKPLHDAKRVMHLPYECVRGSLDHAHLLSLWSQDTHKKCCGGCSIS